MRVWRLTTARYTATAFSGEGARLYGGRWNSHGISMVYTSEHLSLAVLEYLVGLAPEEMPEDLVRLDAEIPDRQIEVLVPTAVGSDWRTPRRPSDLQAAGDNWIRSGRSLALEVPSAVVPEETNVLVNPGHAAVGEMTVGDPAPFTLDPRLWR